MQSRDTLLVAQTRKMKEDGMGKIDHHPAIEPSDLAKLYDYMYVCANLASAELLQKKVSLLYFDLYKAKTMLNCF